MEKQTGAELVKGIYATTSGGGDFETPAAGSYIARCYKMVDVGTQEVMYQGKPSTPKRQVLIWFELLEDEDGKLYTMSDGQPFTVMQRYTLSTAPVATLRKHIDAWRGKALTKEEAEQFNIVKLLDQTCRLGISLDEKGDRTWVNISSVGYTKKTPKGVNDAFWWTIDEPDMKAFEEFPEWLQNKIRAAKEWGKAKNADAVDATIASNGDIVPTELEDGDPLDISELKF